MRGGRWRALIPQYYDNSRGYHHEDNGHLELHSSAAFVVVAGGRRDRTSGCTRACVWQVCLRMPHPCVHACMRVRFLCRRWTWRGSSRDARIARSGSLDMERRCTRAPLDSPSQRTKGMRRTGPQRGGPSTAGNCCDTRKWYSDNKCASKRGSADDGTIQRARKYRHCFVLVMTSESELEMSPGS